MRAARTFGLALAAAWLAVVPSHADELPATDARRPSPVSWEVARDQLRVQIRRESDPHALGAVVRQDLLDTRTVLVRSPGPGGGLVDVTVDEAAAWGRPPEELFQRGLDNLESRQPPIFRSTPKLRHGVQINLLYGEHSLAAAYALAVKHYPTCMGNRGALVAVPNRHATLCYPVESARAFHAYLALVSLSVDLQFEGEDPIVPHVYWFHDGTFEAQPVRIEGKRHIVPTQTDAFAALMKALPDDILAPRRRRR